MRGAKFLFEAEMWVCVESQNNDVNNCPLYSKRID